MSKIKTKELIICIVTLMILVLSIVTDVFASDIMDTLGNNSAGNNNISEIVDRGNDTTSNNTIGNNSTNNITANNVTTNKVTNKTNNTANNTNKTTMPDTGVDYSILLIVAVCGISAIYAYKKISDYKNF